MTLDRTVFSKNIPRRMDDRMTFIKMPLGRTMLITNIVGRKEKQKI
jgi:hypothetical protein